MKFVLEAERKTRLPTGRPRLNWGGFCGTGPGICTIGNSNQVTVGLSTNRAIARSAAGASRPATSDQAGDKMGRSVIGREYRALVDVAVILVGAGAGAVASILTA